MNGRSEADRLREHRLIFERAQADGVDMAEAKRRIARDRWAECDRRINARRRCGTRLMPPSRTPAMPIPTNEEGERTLEWWQR